jgi:2-polyprenyl-6-methoxyphenol hydroxylase-like FAD-dependent oxidoreductase
MNKQLRVGVVGCGTAGPAVAILLARAGHEVCLFERAAAPAASGAGIVLQPPGQAVLAALGLLDEVVTRGARIDELIVDRAERGRLLKLDYKVVNPTYFGLGVHRGVIFQSLYAALQTTSAKINLGVTCTSVRKTSGRQYWLDDAAGESWGPFDLVIAADGARSQLRNATQLTSSADSYPWGAVWSILPDSNHTFRSQLYQVVNSTNTLLGVLPTGTGPLTTDAPQQHISLFWSVRADQWSAFRARPITEFKQSVQLLIPALADVLRELQAPEQLLYSSYMDVVMQRWHTRHVVHLGDSAHAMSPQLGQGANLALLDAWTLAQCLNHHETVPAALDAYSRTRRSHLNYYQLVTRWLTPFFQSDYALLGWLRDLGMPILNRFSVFNRAMAMGMCGTADGHPWRTLRLPSPATH